jgi:hypothetical protein
MLNLKLLWENNILKNGENRRTVHYHRWQFRKQFLLVIINRLGLSSYRDINTVLSGRRSLTFSANVPPPSLGLKSKSSKHLPTTRQKALSILKICLFLILINDIIIYGLYGSNSCSTAPMRHRQSLGYSRNKFSAFQGT